MEIKDRLRILRKQILKLSQDEFSKSIHISRSNLGNMETGRIAFTDRNIQLICSIHNVNENWLRTGEGNPLLELSEDEKIAKWIGATLGSENENTAKRRIITVLSQLEEDEWEFIEKLAIKIANSYPKDQKKTRI